MRFRRLISATIATVGVGVIPAFALLGAPIASAAPEGAITELSTTGMLPFGIAAGSDGNLWFTDESCQLIGGSCKIGRVTPSGQITEFTSGLNAGSVPSGITEGPDGNIWFADQGATAAVGRITPGGQITEFSNGLSGAPGDIAVGPDGELWFTEQGTTPAIGRITVGGQITEFHTGLSADAQPWELTTGPDGNVWFTDQGITPAIGRVTPDGQITEFGSAGDRPADIAAGPDGTLWVALGGAAIGRVSPTGSITRFTTGLGASASVVGIAPGPDRTMWFTDRSDLTPAIGRITLDGRITEYTTGLNSGSWPRQIASGPDGNMWFTDGACRTPGLACTAGTAGTGAPAASVRAPSVTGSGQQGTQHVCQGDQWSPWAGELPVDDAISSDGFRWLRDGVLIAGQRAQSYTPTVDDVGHVLSCRVTVTYTLLAVTESSSSAGVTVIPQASGPIGGTGSPGVPGLTGPTGPTGPAGPQGTPGQVELVSCKQVTVTVTRKRHKVKVKRQKCSTKLVSGPVKFKTARGSGRASLSRSGVVYATGYVRRTLTGVQTRLLAARRLAPGRYTLRITIGRGRGARATRTEVTIRA